jgi:hypothetical protein
MPLYITHSKENAELLDATETRREDQTVVWRTDRSLCLSELVELLASRGWHQTDIGDALYALDPGLVGLRN